MNQVQFDAAPFVAALQQAILTTKDPSPHPAYPCVEVTASGADLTLRCLDGNAETVVVVPIEPVLLPWSTLVRAQDLLDAVRSFVGRGDEAVHVTLTLATTGLSVKPSGSEDGHELAVYDCALPTFEVDPKVEYRVNLDGDCLRLALTRALSATRLREAEQWRTFTTCGVFVKCDGSELTMTGTDLTQMIHTKVGGRLDFGDTPPSRESRVIATRVFGEAVERALRDRPGQKATLTVTDRFVELSVGTLRVRSMLIHGTYPPCQDIVPSRTHVLTFDKAELQAAVNVATAVTDPDSESVTLSVTPGKLVLSKRGKRSTATLYGPWDVTRDNIHLDPQRLKAFLSRTAGPTVEMILGGGEGRLVGQRNGVLFMDAGSDAYQYVLMPLDKSHR
jgi:DNA polymerase III sliding clamp (beta) subunit (PCNA family)